MHAHQRTALIGDVGGTHARFAICDIDELSVTHFAVFQTSMFASLPEAIAHYLESVPIRPEIAGFSVSAPLNGETITMTNCPWTFTRAQAQEAAGVEKIHFLNDFEALALSLPYLKAHDRHQLGGGKPVSDGTMLVLGPGSAFGCAALKRAGKGWVPVSGEGGHAAFAATDETELAILAKVADKTGYAPVQAVLSGKGLVAIHETLAELDGKPAPEMTSLDIINAAYKDDDREALRSIDRFTTILARIAGDMALTFGARGGVYIGRGMTPKLLQTLKEKAFRERFETKGPFSAHLAQIPVYALLATDAGLRGAALAVSEAFPMEPAV